MSSSKHSAKSSQGSISSEGDIFFEATGEVEIINENEENEERIFNNNYYTNNNPLKNKNGEIWQYHKNNSNSSNVSRMIRHYPSSSLDSTVSTAYMTPQSSTSNLLMRLSVQSVINQSNNNQSEVETSSYTTPFFITGPSSSFDPNRQTIDFSTINNDDILNNKNTGNSTNPTAVAAKVKEYESLINRNSLNPIIESDINPVESSSSPKYNHTVEPSSGSNTYVGDSYDHIENVLHDEEEDQEKHLTKEVKEVIVKPKPSVNRKINNDVIKDRNRMVHNRNNSSREIIIEEEEEEDNSIPNSKRISKLSFIATKGGRDTTTLKSSSTTEVDDTDSPISQRRTSATNDIIIAFSQTTSISRENVIRIEIWDKVLLISGCCLIFFLAILDINLVANQLPKIVEEFEAGEDISWIINSYNLTSTILQPLCGSLSNIFGKKWVFLVSILIFGTSSVLCGASQNIQWLISSRAAMGIGGGLITSMTFIIISEVMPIRKRVYYNTIMYVMFGLAFIIGPLLGGLFVDYVSWRWSFYMNGLLSILSIILLSIALRKLGKPSGNILPKLKRVDWFGIFLLGSGLLLLLFGLNYGGNKFPWNSVTTYLIFGTGVVIIMLFGLYEKRFAKEPMIPTFMLKDPSIRAIFGCFYLMGWIQVIVIYYTPMYFQYVLLQSATQSGISLLPLVSSVIIFCAIGGLLLFKFGRYRWIIYVGSISLIGGGFLLTTFNLNTGIILRTLSLIIIGCGIGSQFILLKPALCAVKEREKSIIIGLCNFFRGYGLIFGISISTALFNNHLLSNMRNAQNFPINNSLNDVLLLNNIIQLDEQQMNIVLNSINNGIVTNYVLCTFIAVMGLIFASFIKHYNFKKDQRSDENNNNNLNEKI